MPQDDGGCVQVGWITLTEAENLLGVSKAIIHRWTQKGMITDNGKKGRKKMLSKISVLFLKQEGEDTAMQKDVQELCRDFVKYS